MKKIKITESADEDFYNMIDYLSNFSLESAVNISSKVKKAIDRLAENPRLGVAPKHQELVNKGYLMLIVEKYLVFYVILDEVIEVRYIIHGSRDYKYLVE